jgi:hypothetical protein
MEDGRLARLGAIRLSSPAVENQVEILAAQRVDSRQQGAIWFQGFEDRRARIRVSLLWTEGAPLRRKAIRSLTIRLNVPVVR